MLRFTTKSPRVLELLFRGESSTKYKRFVVLVVYVKYESSVPELPPPPRVIAESSFSATTERD